MEILDFIRKICPYIDNISIISDKSTTQPKNRSWMETITEISTINRQKIGDISMMSNAQTFNFCLMGQCWINPTSLYMKTFKSSLIGQMMDEA